MSVPAGYDDAQLAAFMLAVLGPTAAALGWTAPAHVSEPLIETLVAYGVDDIAAATDVPKLRALARWQAWEAAAEALASRYDVSTDGQALSRAQLYTHARQQAARAARQATVWLAGGAVTVTPIRRSSDPYLSREVVT